MRWLSRSRTQFSLWSQLQVFWPCLRWLVKEVQLLPHDKHKWLLWIRPPATATTGLVFIFLNAWTPRCCSAKARTRDLWRNAKSLNKLKINSAAGGYQEEKEELPIHAAFFSLSLCANFSLSTIAGSGQRMWVIFINYNFPANVDNQKFLPPHWCAMWLLFLFSLFFSVTKVSTIFGNRNFHQALSLQFFFLYWSCDSLI